MSQHIQKIDIIGDCAHDSTCSHFCMITYFDGTYHTVKMSGFEIVEKYWCKLSPKDKPHFQYIHDLTFLKKVKVSKNIIRDNKHACEFTYKNGEKTKYLVDKEYIRFYKDYIN